MTNTEKETEIARLVHQRESAAECAREETDREYKADMYRLVDRINDEISRVAAIRCVEVSS